jgi:hypothetical protein
MATLRKAGKLVSLNSNPTCKSKGEKAGKLPAPYYFWKGAKDTGEIFLDTANGCGDNTSITVKNCSNACALYSSGKFKPGEMYAYEIDVKGRPVIKLNFQKDGQWVRGMQTVSPLIGKPDANGWCKARGVVVMPAGTDMFVIKMSTDRVNGKSQSWFDNINIYKLW